MSKRAKTWLIVTVGLAIYAALAWFVGTFLGLEGADLWRLRSGLWFIGTLAAAAVLWFLRAPPAPKPSAGGEEIDTLMAAARAHLASARVTRKARFDNLPVIVLLGPSGSTKTSLVLQSGLDAELLAGEGIRESSVAPTRTVNLWYGGGIVLLEAGGALSSDPGRWSRLLRHLQPRRLQAALSGGTQAPRLAVVCYGCDELTAPEVTATAARLLRERLIEITQQLGIRLPVYVIFTKADQLPFFAEYVRNLSREQSRDVFGATLPLETVVSPGSYVDRETDRLNDAFQRLFQSLAARRLEVLAREHETDLAGRAYEFPRELRKVAAPAVSFMVELCRPSQLQVSPFLRGFYFTGVRAVAHDEAAPVSAARSAGGAYPLGSVAATGIFHQGAQHPAAAVAPPVPAVVRREFPQWLFVERLFRDVIARDEIAMGVTQGGVRVNMLRRLILAGLCALSLLVALGFLVSYLGNRALIRRVAEARREVGALASVRGGLPSTESLRRLDRLGSLVDSLSRFSREGPPWRWRWGLYPGDALLPFARPTYFEGFGNLLFGGARVALLDSLRALPDTARGADHYGSTYRRLKAHLITTVRPDSSSVQFLAPVLMSHWQAGRRLDPERAELARRQFALYARELPFGNPYAIGADSVAVERARAFLRRYSGEERVYQSMIADAGRQARAVRFDATLPQARAYVSDPYEVPGAYTRAGWNVMLDALDHAERYLGGESWVIGEDSGPPLDQQRVVEELRTRYLADYKRHWLAFLDSASIVPFAGLKDASQKLAVLSGNQSPLLALFALASRHTAVRETSIAKAYLPLHVLMPDTSKKLVSGVTSTYVSSLDGLQVAVERAAAAPMGGSDAAVSKALESADNAKLEVKKIARSFGSEAERGVGAVVQALMVEPISRAETLLRGLGPAQMNAAGAAFCAPVRQLMTKFPFNRRSTSPASPAEVAKIFQPGSGTLWTLQAEALQKVMERRGREFVATESGETRVTPEFVRFFNRAVLVSEALFPTGDADPRLSFRLTPVLSGAISSVTLAIEGQTARFTRETPETKSFTGLLAASRLVGLFAELGEGVEVALDEVDEPWGIFRLFHGATRWQTAGDSHLVEWSLTTGRQGGRTVTAGGSTAKVAFRLDFAGQPAVLRPGFFDGLSCSGVIVR
jgi:type VI secretion system protein ImpL